MNTEPTAQDLLVLKKELVGLFGHLQKIRKELAALNPPGAPDHFGSMSEQLDAIVNATEGATNTIMESMEGIDGLMNEARGYCQGGKLGDIFDQVTDKVNTVFEACSFQDITGQRVTKVVVEIKEDQDPDKQLLHGPQLPGQGISQADVDKMLAQTDIDKLFG